MVLKLYVAGPFVGKDDVASVEFDIQEEFGVSVEIVSHWRQREGGLELMPQNAILDLEELNQADALVAVMPAQFRTYPFKGTFTEIGYALGQKKHVFIVGEFDQRFSRNQRNNCGVFEYDYEAANNVFFWHKDIELVYGIVSLLHKLQKIIQ